MAGTTRLELATSAVTSTPLCGNRLKLGGTDGLLTSLNSGSCCDSWSTVNLKELNGADRPSLPLQGTGTARNWTLLDPDN